jgi:hypothetical protein
MSCIAVQSSLLCAVTSSRLIPVALRTTEQYMASSGDIPQSEADDSRVFQKSDCGTSRAEEEQQDGGGGARPIRGYW